ncbi:hypothetical protein DXG03_002452 [Asterophora parasitica]|uniref:TPR-like protein n=1 Tax=Asterophora parasitica TaxID=117018 RepID=A0A9P7KCE3_9AGAR|nr:hypothetical protein DXG03_002452 [Asterophora parasitica]
MGRTATQPRPSFSGAVIFYGASRSSPKRSPTTPTVDLSDLEDLSTLQSPTTTSTRSKSPTSITTTDSTTTFSSLSVSNGTESGSTSVSSLSIKSKDGGSHVLGDTCSKQPTCLTSNDFSAILALAKDTALLFANVPYIEVVTGMVQQIIQISADVRTNKERSKELIDKVVLYAGVIFEALNKLPTDDGLEELKSDLLHIARWDIPPTALMSMNGILESLYKVLESLSVPTLAARINRVVAREEILSRLEEQDRRLDTMITSFQLKSAIVLRAKPTESVQRIKMPEVERAPQALRPKARLQGKPPIMFGRNLEIERIVGIILQQVPARVAVLGPGGIGKTSLALSIVHDPQIAALFSQNRLFISCEAATCVDHIIGDLALSLKMAADGYSGQLVDAVLDRLSRAPYLIVLDNFETPWEVPIARSNVESFLQDLADLDTATLLITVRGSQHPPGVSWSQLLPPLQPVDLDSAIEIFTAISHKSDEYAVKLIQAVDRVPLAVTLLGNLAAVDGETTEALWRRWCDESIAMVESGDDKLSSLSCSIEISLSSPRIRRDPDALKLLSLLSILPEGVSSDTVRSLESGVPGISNVKRAISTLRQNALITMDAYGFIRILSPIRLHICARCPPSRDGQRFLQDYFLNLARQGILHHDAVLRKRLCAESGNIEALLLDSLEHPLGRSLEDTVEAILSFCHHIYLFGLGSSSAVALAAEKLATSSHPPSQNQSPSVNRTERPRRFAGLRFWKDAPKTLPLTPSPESPIRYNETIKLRGDCLGCWGQLLSRQSHFEEAEAKFDLAIQLHIKAGDIAGHAYDLHNLGCLLSRKASTFPRAHDSFDQALILHQQVGDKVGAAYDLMGSGQLLLQQTHFSDAKETFEKALQLFLENGDLLGQASALNNIGHVVLSFSTSKAAEPYFLQALEINSGLGDTIGQADSLAGLACTLLLRSRFPEARQKIEEAIALRSHAENPDHLHLLGRLFIAEYDFEKAKETILRSKVHHEQVGDERGTTEDMRYLLRIQFYQGRLSDDISMENDGGRWAVDRRLDDLQRLHDAEDRLGLADTSTTTGMIRHQLAFDSDALDDLTIALAAHIKLGNILGQAVDHHHIGCRSLRFGEFDKAEKSFRTALKLHTEADNVQGQADDHNKLAELFLRRGLFQEALAEITCRALKLHTQIGDVGGQGDDIYIQACVFLEQSRLEEAEDMIRRALDLHSKAGLAYAQGLDLATLSSVLWQRATGEQEVISSRHIESLQALDKAAEIFRRCLAFDEMSACCEKYMGILKEDAHLKDIPTVGLSTDLSGYDYGDWY